MTTKKPIGKSPIRPSQLSYTQRWLLWGLRHGRIVTSGTVQLGYNAMMMRGGDSDTGAIVQRGTLTSLEQRGIIAIEKVSDNKVNWVLTDVGIQIAKLMNKSPL